MTKRGDRIERSGNCIAVENEYIETIRNALERGGKSTEISWVLRISCPRRFEE